MSVFLVSIMIIQSVRLLVLAYMRFSDPMLTTVNITVCYILVLIASISILPRISLVCTCINIMSIFLCLYITDNSMYSQLLIIFGFTSVVTTAFGFVADKLLREQQIEFNDYASTVDQVLHVFDMSKSELLALLKLAKSQDNTAVYDKELMALLDNRTLHNIKRIASQIEHMQACQRKEMSQRFPMLTPAELDVCRLVEQGLTIKDISVALGKSVSNVSTVRGNVRKKLGLAQDDNLRSVLLENRH